MSNLAENRLEEARAYIKKALAPELQRLLKPAERTAPREGLPTGLQELDEKLIWKGLPQGQLSLLMSEPGHGATSLWMDAALRLNQQKKWVAWFEGESLLCPTSLWQRGFDLSRLVSIDPQWRHSELNLDRKQLAARTTQALSEIFSSQLFSMIGCDLGSDLLPDFQLRQLAALARQYHTALVFITRPRKLRSPEQFALILKFASVANAAEDGAFATDTQIVIERALHRPTPQTIQRRIDYARFTQTTFHLTPSALPDSQSAKFLSFRRG